MMCGSESHSQNERGSIGRRWFECLKVHHEARGGLLLVNKDETCQRFIGGNMINRLGREPVSATRCKE